MERKPSSSKDGANQREARLKAALKANLARRKQQARARRTRDEDNGPSGKDKD